MNYALAFIFFSSLLTTLLITPWLIPKLKRAGIVGKDMNKPNKPEIPEMGGFTIIFGLTFGILVAIGFATFFHSFDEKFNITYLLAASITILIMAFIGIFDDLFVMHQGVKATLPLFAALPLVAVRAGSTAMVVPFLGQIDFGIFYILILVPIAIAGASNVTNMLAGFNGLEAGMGFIACSTMAFIAWRIEATESLIILLAMSGALLAFLYFNWNPARILIGDIGTLTIGTVIASSVIIGNFERFGIILILPYAVDFFIKAWNKFPSKNWWGIYKGGKLYSPEKPVGFCQMIMKWTGGVSERDLVLILMGIEGFFSLVVILLVL